MDLQSDKTGFFDQPSTEFRKKILNQESEKDPAEIIGGDDADSQLYTRKSLKTGKNFPEIELHIFTNVNNSAPKRRENPASSSSFCDETWVLTCPQSQKNHRLI